MEGNHSQVALQYHQDLRTWDCTAWRLDFKANSRYWLSRAMVRIRLHFLNLFQLKFVRGNCTPE